LLHQRCDRSTVNPLLGRQQLPQRLVHRRLTLPRRQVQDFQVFLVRPHRAL
jgi:hypothetical protein